jgi:DedD protein
MDHELKQRLIGAVVVTALAAIFIPMLFDDPIDTSGKTVKELTIPEAPAEAAPENTQKLPDNKAQVLNRPDIELNATEVNEDNQVNALGEAPVTNVPDGEQAGMTDTGNGSGSDISGFEPGEGSTPEQPDQTENSGLDTGVVQEADQPDDSQNKTGTTTDVVKKPQQSRETATKKPASKPDVSKKIKVKPVSSTEKPKSVDKTHKASANKPSSKLVRYSIQAGSFNKKENAQALVEKLRKQGMPASLVTKGDYFRVKIGPALDKENAQEMKAKLDKQNITGLLTSE